MSNMLLESYPRPIKYLYMGINIESSNIALPTSRLIESVKARKRENGGASGSAATSLHDREAVLKKGTLKNIWLFVRLANRLAEEWYRQLMSWIYRKRGFIVLYDRHFLFDFEKNGKHQLPLAEKIHRWCLHQFYPEPDLVIFLNAPPEVLFARKGEATLEYLSERRDAYLAQGELSRNFEQVDATQPVAQVYATICQKIETCYKEKDA